MRPSIFAITVALSLGMNGQPLLAQKQPAPKQPVAKQPASQQPASKQAAAARPDARPATVASREADEKAIRQAAEAFGKAYNAHDAKALAALFAADAEIVNEQGDSTQGRGEIENVFADVFAEHPQTMIAIDLKSIRFVSPSVAIEDGTTATTHVPDEAAEHSRYTVVHVRQDGKWSMASARDLSDETAEEELDQLAWLIGDWLDESPDAVVMTSTSWSDNHRFILSEFTIQVAGRPLLQGSQRIAWDPLAKVLRSWIFDSEGGFAEGIYSRDGQQWTIKLSGVSRDGELVSATNTMTRISNDRAVWQSRDRTSGSEAQGDIEPVMIVRKPPNPM